MKRVAVIILNWNGAALLRRYLPTVIEGTDDAIADIIVADNGSTDASMQVLQDEFPGVRTLRFDANHGFAGGYNLAIGQTMYPYTVLLNSDVRTPRVAQPPAGLHGGASWRGRRDAQVAQGRRWRQAHV